jgi:hypothetical protein
MSVSEAAAGEQAGDGAELDGEARRRARALVAAVADGLGEQGLDITGQEWEKACYLKASNAWGALGEATVGADGTFSWEYRPVDGGWGDAGQMAAMVGALLGTEWAGDPRPAVPGYPGQTVKGAVGLMARAAGLRARLGRVIPDDQFLEVSAEVEITDPERPERGRVWVTDNVVRWECRLADGAGAGLQPAEVVMVIGRSVPQLRVLNGLAG